MLVSLNTGFYNEGEYIEDRKFIIKKYFKKWIWIDLISSFPYSWTIENPLDLSNSVPTDNENLIELIRITRIIRILRLLRIFKLKRIMR